MKIQQHDGVVVDAAGSRQGFAKHKRGGEVLRREREAPRARYGCPPSLPLYIGARGRMPPWRSHLKGGAAAPGGNGPLRVSNQGAHAPSGGNGPLGFSTLGALGPWGGAHQPSRGWFPPIFSPISPPGQVAPPGGPLDTFWWSRYNTDNPRNHSGD